MTTIGSETARQVLDLSLPDNDADAVTVRDYLIKLLALAWRYEADYNGKRPFGNSGWQYEVYAPLVRAGLVAGTFDEHGELGGEFEYRDANKLILAAIDELGKVPS